MVDQRRIKHNKSLGLWKGGTFKLSKYAWNILPYLVSLLGVLFDYLTTTIGLGLGFNETNLSYNPLLAIAFFWGIITFLNLTLVKGRFLTVSKDVIVLASFLGVVNNTLVITGIYNGLRIL
ncbi:MAG: hypothetical protein QG670_884 [Thermoproteota archaeon]|nr:hypothetical protein [Thermoproteota archaeon]